MERSSIFQGWDDEGIEYRVQQNININVRQ